MYVIHSSSPARSARSVCTRRTCPVWITSQFGSQLWLKYDAVGYSERPTNFEVVELAASAGATPAAAAAAMAAAAVPVAWACTNVPKPLASICAKKR